MTRLRRPSALPMVIGASALATLFVIGILPVALAGADALRAPREAVDALIDPLLWSRLGTTIVIAALVLGLAIPIGMVQAWLLVRTDVPCRRGLLMLTPLPLFLPPLVHVLSWFGWLGLAGLPAIVLVYVISLTPFVVLLSARALEQIGCEHAETMRVIGGRRLLVLDEMRQTLPAALVGAALILVFLLSDFAVADFLTSVGPNVSVYADTLYAHHLAMRSAGAVGAALPGLAVCLLLLLSALRARRRLGASVGARFSAAASVPFGPMRWPLGGFAAMLVGAGTVLPFASLLYQVGSPELLREQLMVAFPRIRFTLQVAALSATGMVMLALPLTVMAMKRPRLRGWLDMLVALPLAVPPLILGIGLIRTWNHALFDALYLGSGVVVIAMIGRYLAFAVLPISGAWERLDPAMDEAAQLSGASSWSRLLRVQGPLIASSVIAAWCLSFCFTLRELDTLIMLRAGQQSLPHHLYANVVFAREDETAAIALILAFVTAAPLLLYLALARRALRFL